MFDSTEGLVFEEVAEIFALGDCFLQLVEVSVHDVDFLGFGGVAEEDFCISAFDGFVSRWRLFKVRGGLVLF